MLQSITYPPSHVAERSSYPGLRAIEEALLVEVSRFLSTLPASNTGHFG